MNRAYLKHLFIILVILLICSGCKQSQIIGENFLSERPEYDSGAVKYKSGAVLVKNKQQYNVTNQKNFVNPNVGSGEIKFGPRNINFEN